MLLFTLLKRLIRIVFNVGYKRLTIIQNDFAHRLREANYTLIPEFLHGGF